MGKFTKNWTRLEDIWRLRGYNMARYPWKEYYALERAQKRGEIETAVRKCGLTSATDSDVSGVLKSGGILSFPHTHIEDSLEALIRIVDSLYKTGKRKVIALGVLHNSSGDGRDQKEFSLDGFEHIARMYAEVNGTEPLEIDKVYPPDEQDGKPYVQKLEAAGKALRDTVDGRTAVVMTGDLVHYGHAYLKNGKENEIDARNFEKTIISWIDEGLELVYRKKDYDTFLSKHKPKAMNDQGRVAIMASAFLGDDLDYKIFYRKLSDYSNVLGAKKPTLVASVFYGVQPKKATTRGG